jgi:hypothetical protein
MLITAKLASIVSAEVNKAHASVSSPRPRSAQHRPAIATTTQTIGQPSGVSISHAPSDCQSLASAPGSPKPSVLSSLARSGALPSQ